jgi:hypothetical protein
MAQLQAGRVGQMLDVCEITRPENVGQTPVLDGDGNVANPPDPTVYTGACTLSRFKSSGVRATIAPTVNDEAGVPEPRTLKVPHGADVRSGDRARMTACAFSPDLVGEVFVVLHEDPRTYATFRSFTVRGSSWRA